MRKVFWEKGGDKAEEKMKKTSKNLKTLKDLVQHSNANIILVSDLRSAAREWIRDIEAHSKEIDHADLYHQGSIDWIEIFFNLDKKKK